MDIFYIKLILALVLFIGFPLLYFIVTFIFSIVRVVKSLKLHKVEFKSTILPIIICLCGTTILGCLCYFGLMFSLWSIKSSL